MTVAIATNTIHPARNCYQPASPDWHGLYPGDASMDPVLFPRVRKQAEKPQQLGLLDMDGDERVDSTCHPAKMSLPLLKKILATMEEFGWLRQGDTLVDPFGGRMSTGLVWTAKSPGNRAVCIELEPHFVRMGHDNQRHAERLLGRPLGLEIIQGDSRTADDLLRELGGAAVTSPPYGKSTIGKCDVEKLKALTEDPSSSLYGRNPEGSFFQAHGNGYVNSPGNIDNLPDGDWAAITSPPYEGSLASDDPDKRGGLFRDPKRRNDRTLTGTYGAAVTSPPYEDSVNDRNGVDVSKCEKAGATSQAHSRGYSGVTSPPYEAQSGGHKDYTEGSLDAGVLERHAASRIAPDASYGQSDAQIGATQGESYASAVRDVYSALARAGVRYLVTVTKNPTRKGKLRRLDKLTARLLREAGYRVVAWRRAWLFEDGAQLNARHGQPDLLDGGKSKKVHGRLSFFRRLHLAKGAVAAQWEDVLFCVLNDAPTTPLPAPPALPWLVPPPASWEGAVGDAVVFEGMDAQTLSGTITQRDGARLRIRVVVRRTEIDYEFDKTGWPRGLRVGER